MRRVLIFVIVAALLILAIVCSARFLVIDNPQRSDVIVVLAGDTDSRPKRAVELFDRGFDDRLMVDVPAGERVFGFTELELAQRWIQTLPHAEAITICPTHGLSTKTEAKDVASCLTGHGWHNVLIVTSDFHTRRALSTFSRELPGYQFSVAASHQEHEFGVNWWRHRQWAKVNLDEWLRLMWWYAVDRWR